MTGKPALDVLQLGEAWLEECLARIPRARITVFGDFCLDCYWLIRPKDDETSVETALPVRRIERQRYSLGGAGNIVANLADLGVRTIRAVGLVGKDLFGCQMLELLGQVRADCSGLLHQDDWQTLAYCKPYLEGQELNRLDFGAFSTLAEETADALAATLEEAAAQSDVVILNQQIPGGVSTQGMIRRINEIIRRHGGCRFIVDSRHRADQYKGCMLKVNAHEASRLLGSPVPLDRPIVQDQARRLATGLFERTGQTVFVTRGENGLLVADQSGLTEIPGIQIVSQTDPVGAGDTALSAIAAVLGSGGDALQAGALANIAASITVRKLQTTGTASPAEVRAVGPLPDYVFLPELADDPRQARFLADCEIEVIRPCPANVAIRHAVFDHDGTLSTLRQGWEAVMEPMMVRAILGRQFATADAGLYRKVVDTVGRFIDKTTGIQTLCQMQGLIELVQQFGCVEPAEILDMHGYKRLYDQDLLAMVRARGQKLARHELDPQDFQIKNAHRWLEALHSRGVKLYLASGTDQADVIAEAEALGYAHLFEGRIFGAVGDIRVEAKAVVLKQIFEQHHLVGPEVVTFGDGPVEIRQTRKRGGIAVGVASDEVRRFGLNGAKRARLIRAGADLVVPDFSQIDALLKALGLGAAGL